MHLLGFVGFGSGNLFHNHLAAASGEFEEFLGKKVDDGIEADAGIDGVLQREHAAAEVVLQLAEGLVEVGLLVVKLVDDEDNRLVHLLGPAPL